MPHTQHPVSPEQLAANRVNAGKSTGPRTPQGKARSTQNARKHGFTASTFAVERIALAQQAIFRAARLEAGLFTTCLNEVLDDRDTPLVGLDPDMVGDLEITRAQNRNYLLGEGFHRMASKSNSWSLFLRYQAQAERHGAPSGPRAVEEFERLKALREELPNEAILEAQPEQTETTCTPSETNPSPPEDPAPAPDPPASVSELELDLAGASGVLEDPEVEARHPNNAPAPQPASPVIGGEAWSLPEQRAREAPLADS